MGLSHLARFVNQLLSLIIAATIVIGVSGKSLVYDTRNQYVLIAAEPHHPFKPPSNQSLSLSNIDYTEALHDLHAAIEVMQTEYFSLWLGEWTKAIDWTGAVINTHFIAALSSLSNSLAYTFPRTPNETSYPDSEAQRLENEINKYFTHSIGYYFTEDILSIRNEAFDDMLWVVLNWLGSIRFIDSHSKTHYPSSTTVNDALEDSNATDWWHARQFVSAFAHRARVFYELAEQGWDETLCGGGMLWNPRLDPYKNAVTSQLFIAASVEMYLYFPGDNNDSPFSQDRPSPHHRSDMPNLILQNKEKYLAAAIRGYEWLRNINMTNTAGLYVDGYHISNFSADPVQTTCDERDEKVYTYNQGIILSVLRHLFEATGNYTYLYDGHNLIHNVIRETGWCNSPENPSSSSTNSSNNEREGIGGQLGSSGILTETCDPDSSCTQDSQTFKGIFFHHYTIFCFPLSPFPEPLEGFRGIPIWHQTSCSGYLPWVLHNARAAMRSRNQRGVFGGWWGASGGGDGDDDDPNERGKGRTVETMSSGLAALRAAVEGLKEYGVTDTSVYE
ncbi:unnamed protein product [Periconia digitata]|uniref:Glycoside hydrolase family 76 protein n=1 Tax=Periconia digitata TaxID=1303443 RepID=A0A9W4XK46_9PLEO|nr:unnamed protein product [Periconia digitata]